jgi:intein/homing endonuclease
LIDTACKSVGGETEITIVENGIVRRVPIGFWIDEKMEANGAKIRRSDYLDQELLDLDKPVQIQTIDDFGNASWEDLTAVTRHNPTPDVYFVKTESGREAIIADSETLLIWNGKTFQKKKTSEVKVGDEVPVLLPLEYEASQVVNDVFKDEVIELEKIQLDEGEKLYDVTVPKTLNFCLANGLCVRDKDVSLTASCREKMRENSVTC